MTPGYRGSNGEEAARHKQSRATCSGDTVVTLPYLQESPKPVWDFVFILHQTSMGVMEQCQGPCEGPRDSTGTHGHHGKESLLHPSHSRAQRVAGGWEESLWTGWQKNSDPKMIRPAILRDVRWGGAEDDVEVSSL